MTDASASLDALGIKPVAWLYNCDGDVWAAALEPEPIVEDDWTETPLYSATDLAPLIAKARRVEKLEAALTLAANRMDVMALAVIHENNARRYEWKEWAQAARAALKENTDG